MPVKKRKPKRYSYEHFTEAGYFAARSGIRKYLKYSDLKISDLEVEGMADQIQYYINLDVLDLIDWGQE